MKDLMTRKIVLGMLMVLVLAFSVQGIADALKLAKKAGDLQTKPVASNFEITFSVTRESDSTKIYNSNGQQVDEYGNEIDSSGYLIKYVKGNARRLISVSDPGLNDANAVGSTITSYAVSADDLGVSALTDLKVRLPTDRSNITSFGDRLDAQDNTPTPPFYLSGSNVVDKMDRAVYIEGEPNGEGKYKYTRAKAEPVAPYSSNASQRYAYNDEQIMITSTFVTSNTDAVTKQAELKRVDRGNTYTLGNADGTGDPPGRTLGERLKPLGIPSSITLRIETNDDPAGIYSITISDSPSRPNDYPKPKPHVPPIVFTLYTTDGTGDPHSTTTVTVAPDDRSQSTSLPTLQINELYERTGETTDTPTAHILLVYQVIEGPGTLYLGKREEPTGTPSQSLTTSSSVDVFLYLNGGDSKVRVYVDGADPVEDGAIVAFSYTGTDRRTTTTTSNQNQNQQNQQNQQQQTPNRLSISLSGSGDTRTVTVSALAAGTTPRSGIFTTLTTNGGNLSPTSGATPLTSTWTLPSAAGTYTVTATTTAGYTSASDSVTVTVPGTLTASQDGRAIVVRASPAPSSNLTFRLITSGGVSAGFGTIPTTGTGRTFPIGLTTGSHILTVDAEGYNETRVTFTPGTTPATPTTTDTTPTTIDTTPTVSEPDSVSIVGPSQREGTANTELDAALIVQVVDEDDDAVGDARVIFRVRSGQGRLSQRGNGRSVAVQTDSQGYGRANYTPMSASSTVEAEVRGVTRRVTFTITASGGTSASVTRDTGTTTPRTEIQPDVHIGAAQRPPMLWVDGGKIYALVGADVEEFGSGVEGAMNIAVGGGKVYWTEMTGKSSGTINSANLDGSGVKALAETRWSVPMGIAVDTARSRLYWSNSSGKIKRANLNGKQGQTVLQDIASPMDIVLSGGTVYWTQGAGGIGSVNIEGAQRVRHISTGSDTPLSLAIAGGKVYWTEQTGESSGTINSANLDGSGVKELVETRWSVPMGIAVDTARSRLYWSNSSGKIKRANLNGKQGQNVVDGLGTPGDMVLSNSITAPVKATPTDAAKTASTSKYDINGDGAVDSKDVDALIVAVAAGVTDTKYDVTGDGKVDIFDVSAVSSKRDDGAGAAPALLGTPLSIVQIDRLQEQIDLLIASNDRSPDAMRLLIYLQQLIVMARPEKTQLLANYPNPFNPETWIPYELATDTSVKITIYNPQGVVIRTLALGHQSAGYYTGRERAAYWDGRNALGEQVASGIYFYRFETDGMSSMRKMVILK